MSQDIIINKVDFQHNDLLVYYKMKDEDMSCLERAIRLDWRKCPDIVKSLEDLFKAIIKTKENADVKIRFPKRFDLNWEVENDNSWYTSYIKGKIK